MQRNYVPYNPALVQRARYLRMNPTPAEKKLWYDVLQNKRFEKLKFTRQKPLDEFIVDFYCAELKLAIEVDGDTHAEQVDYDQIRTARLNEFGIQLICYTNQEVLHSTDGVYEDLLEKIDARKNETPLVPLDRRTCS